MIVRPNDWSPKFFYQKGWIGSKFPIKHQNAAMRWKKRNHTEVHLNSVQHMTESTMNRNKNMSCETHTKPKTAPQKSRTKAEIVQNLQKLGTGNGGWDEPPALMQSKYSNFRTSISNRKQLLYIKPYTRYQSQHLTIDQKKNQIYKEINNPDLTTYVDGPQNSSQMIEYLTEYKDPFGARQQKQKNKKKMNGHRVSLNVLRQKLKRKCQQTNYSRKINAVQFQ